MGHVAALAAFGWLCAAGALGAPLEQLGTIPLEGVSGRIDHMAVDVDGQRLFVAELGNGTVDVVDLAKGAVLHRISGLKDPQGVGYVPNADLIVVASAGDGTVRLFGGKDYAPAGVIALGDDADNVRFDSASGQIIVGYGDGGLAFIDPRTRAVVAKVTLATHPEAFQVSPGGRTIFVNLPDNREIAVVDTAGGKQAASWKTPGLSANFPMAIVGDGAAVAVAFRSPSRLAVFDAASGSMTAARAICGDADDVYFDARRQRIYVSCGEGAADVLGWNGKTLTEPARVPTQSGARTSIFVPQLDRLFVAARAGWLGDRAAILVFRPAP